MRFESEFKTACKKVWTAFNGWRKRGMWFRVTVLLIIGFSLNFERLFTTCHAPLINELVWTACRAIRYGSEPRVSGAYLRYFHVKASRKLQNQLQAEFKSGRIKLSSDETKLLSQNTHDANYNQLFELAKREKLIPANITLRQTKRAMLAKASKLTAERFDPEWADVKKMIFAEVPFSVKGLQQNLSWFWYSLLLVLPLPVIPMLPWFVLCLTLGFGGVRSKYKAGWIFTTALAVLTTLSWLTVCEIERRHWCCGYYYFRNYFKWQILGISVFLAIWAVIGSILGRRLYKYASKYTKETQVFISLLLISGIILLMPVICFKQYYTGWYSWNVWPGDYLLFRSSAFAPYFATVGLAVSGYACFLIYKNYAEKIKKYKWFTALEYLVISFFAVELIYWWGIFAG